MVVQRKSALQLPLVNGDLNTEDENLSFFERFRRDAERSKQEGNATMYFITFMIFFNAITQPYAMMYYEIPYMFENYSTMTHYYIKVAVWFCVGNMIINWVCLLFYDTSVPKTKDIPFLHMDHEPEDLPDQFAARIQHTAHYTERNGHDTEENPTFSWHYCDKCDMRVPPRAHHCKICKKCILKRDHHCYFFGKCIGLKNQRYFLMLSFYVMVCGLLGGSLTVIYVKNIVWPALSYWADTILPVTLVRYLLGHVSGLHCLFITRVYVELLFGGLGFTYFNSQLTFISQNRTPYEVSKNITAVQTNDVNRNLKGALGDFWGLNFLFPMTPVFPQRDDGMSWDISNNNKLSSLKVI